MVFHLGAFGYCISIRQTFGSVAQRKYEIVSARLIIGQGYDSKACAHYYAKGLEPADCYL